MADEGLANDLPYAERVAKHLEVDLHTIWVGPEIGAQFPWMIAQLDEPLADPAALNAYYICKLARENGIKVLLSGAGGDDLFSGYRRHRALALERWWSWLPAPAREALAQSSQLLPANRPMGRRIAKAFRHADADEAQRLVNYFTWLDPREGRKLWNKEVGAQVADGAIAQPMHAALGEMDRSADALARMLMLDSRFFLIDHNLNYTDKMSMAASVEVRVPFLDNALVDFASRIPARHKLRGPIAKWVLKEAMKGVLPDDVIHRPKSGFGVPLRAWMRREMRDVLEDALSPATLRRRGLFDPAGVARLRERNENGQIDATYPILALACVELWCRNFIDRN
jgi:asparagine synthase (glutamine-hydrolysing)